MVRGCHDRLLPNPSQFIIQLSLIIIIIIMQPYSLATDSKKKAIPVTGLGDQ
jgi:hypothetical protein